MFCHALPSLVALRIMSCVVVFLRTDAVGEPKHGGGPGRRRRRRRRSRKWRDAGGDGRSGEGSGHSCRKRAAGSGTRPSATASTPRRRRAALRCAHDPSSSRSWAGASLQVFHLSKFHVLFVIRFIIFFGKIIRQHKKLRRFLKTIDLLRETIENSRLRYSVRVSWLLSIFRSKDKFSLWKLGNCKTPRN